MPTEWFEPTSAGMEPHELKRHGGFRWWPIEEIARSSEARVRRRRSLARHRLSGCDGIEMPFTREPLENLDAAVFKRDSGPSHQILHGARHEHLAGAGQ